MTENKQSERKRRFCSRSNANEVIADTDLSGKTMLITGCTSGIGRETAKALALKGAHVIMANRNLRLSDELKKEIYAEKSDAKVDLIACDLSSLQSVVAAAKEFKDNHWPLHALILNAGVFGPEQKVTIDGFETTHGVNHVAHQLLIRELLPVLRQSAPSRIVVVASHSHRHSGIKTTDPLESKLEKLCPTPTSGFSTYRLYALSKLCNVLMAFKLHREEHKNHISVYVLHPGSMIATDISRSYGFGAQIMNFFVKPFTKTISQGAATNVYLAGSNEIHDVGLFLNIFF
ncbi:hypothetical protein WR25_20915 isoform A [Diploscapter pachys]|uniref:Uncharacterized protein n=1 Tax=Diploscapter pachys TaxID=2018661 RepID=A0A2A2JDG2_9BILA|nr:hypothetical protein WR25_20915 isoform A [Diploscapter pachys]